MYLVKTDDTAVETDANTLNKELIDFYFSNIMADVRKIVGSKLAMRNPSFITELDTLARYSTFINTDSELMFEKIEAELEFRQRKRLAEKRAEIAALRATYEESVRTMKADIVSMIDQKKKKAVQKMKEKHIEMLQKSLTVNSEGLPLSPVPHDITYHVEVPLYEQDQYHGFILELNKKIILLKGITALRHYANRKKAKHKHMELTRLVEEEQNLNYKLEELSETEVGWRVTLESSQGGNIRIPKEHLQVGNPEQFVAKGDPQLAV